MARGDHCRNLCNGRSLRDVLAYRAGPEGKSNSRFCRGLKLSRIPGIDRLAGRYPARQRVVLPAEPGAALSGALDDLDSAIEGAPQGSTEEILRKASARGQDCRMVFVDNSPSVVFGKYPNRANSLAVTLEACAQAVSRIH